MFEFPSEFAPKTPPQTNAAEKGESQESLSYSLESLREFRTQHRDIIRLITGEIESVDSQRFPPRLRGLLEAAQTFQNEEEVKQNKSNLDARGLLAQAFPDELLSDVSKYRMQKLSRGVYAVFVDPNLSRQLRRGDEAVAVMVKTGVSFVLLKEYSDPGDQKRNTTENIPHETHHLIWKTAQKNETFSSTETDSHYKRSFMKFQDELAARACSGGSLFGYHHLADLSPQEREHLEKEAPGKADKIIERVSGLNDLLLHISQLLVRSETVTKADLLKPIFYATSFDELERELRSVCALIESQPFKPEPVSTGGGWGVSSQA